MSRQDKGKPIFGLKKLPLEVLLKHSQLEVGKLTAYVQELEYDKERLQGQNAELEQQLKEANGKAEQLAGRCSELEQKLNQLKQVLQ